MFELGIIIGVLAVGIAAHEAIHYAVSRLVGARAAFTIRWAGINTTPAVRIYLRDFTPLTLRAVALSPLVLCLPGVALVVSGRGSVPAASTADLLVLLLSLCGIPSVTDIKHAWHAADVELIRAGSYGTHPTHCAAEGIEPPPLPLKQ